MLQMRKIDITVLAEAANVNVCSRRQQPARLKGP